MDHWLPITKSAVIASLVGGLISGLVLARAGLSPAAVPVSILAYFLATILASYLLQPSTARLARLNAHLRAVVSRFTGAPIHLKLLSATVLALAVILAHVFVDADPRELAYISLTTPIIVSFLLFGFGYGLFALIFTCAACFYFFIPPKFNFNFYDWKDVELLAHFVAFSLLCAWVLKFIFLKSLPFDALALEPFVSFPPFRKDSLVSGDDETGAKAVRITAQRKIGEIEAELAARQRQLADADMRYRELRHRIKNDFQAFYFLAVSEAQKSARPEEFLRWVVRLRSAAELYSVLDNKNSDLISMTNYLAAISEALDKMFDGRATIEATVDAAIFFDPKPAKYIGLIYAEAAMNALKHAFPGNSTGKLQMRFGRKGHVFEMTVSDNGVGFDPAEKKRGQGLSLMQNLAGQLAGTIRLEPLPVGSVLRLTFSAPDMEQTAGAPRGGAWPDFVAAGKAIWPRARR
jgi:two-component sensor histidine kinase/ABC-type amino acid transport system permease subunit